MSGISGGGSGGPAPAIPAGATWANQSVSFFGATGAITIFTPTVGKVFYALGFSLAAPLAAAGRLRIFDGASENWLDTQIFANLNLPQSFALPTRIATNLNVLAGETVAGQLYTMQLWGYEL